MGGAEKVNKGIEEAVEVPPKIFEEALGKAEAATEEKKGPKESRREMQARLDFLAQMYAASKAEHAEEEAVEDDEVEQD